MLRKQAWRTGDTLSLEAEVVTKQISEGAVFVSPT